MIQEYVLDGTEFDVYKPGILGEVKGDYSNLIHGQIRGKDLVDRVKELQKQARTLVTTAKKYGLKAVYYVRSDQLAHWKASIGNFIQRLFGKLGISPKTAQSVAGQSNYGGQTTIMELKLFTNLIDAPR